MCFTTTNDDLLSHVLLSQRVHTPFRTASARRAECVRPCNRLLCLENQMAIGYAHRAVGFLVCPRRAAMQELRATENWRRVVKRLNRLRRLRKIWATWDIIYRITRPSTEDYEMNFTMVPGEGVSLQILDLPSRRHVVTLHARS